MHRLAVAFGVVVVLGTVLACKDDKKPVAAVPAIDAGASASSADAGPPRKPKKPQLPPAGPPATATADDCKTTGDYAKPTLRAAAVALKVPEKAVDKVANELAAAFIAACSKQGWPAGLLDCLGKSPNQLTTYQRCFDRLPAAQATPWRAKLDAVITKAGGMHVAAPAEPAGEGKTFEEVCAVFVAEMARLDDCAGAGMYVPKLEEAFFRGRRAEVGGVIPATAEAEVKKLCDERAEMARDVASQMCHPAQ